MCFSEQIRASRAFHAFNDIIALTKSEISFPTIFECRDKRTYLYILLKKKKKIKKKEEMTPNNQGCQSICNDTNNNINLK